MGLFSDMLDEAAPDFTIASGEDNTAQPDQELSKLFASLDTLNPDISAVVEDAGPITSPQDFQNMLSSAASRIDQQTQENITSGLADIGANAAAASAADFTGATAELGTISEDGIKITGDGSVKNPWKVDATNYNGQDPKTAGANIAKLLDNARKEGKNISVNLPSGSPLEKEVDAAYKAIAPSGKSAMQTMQETYGKNPAVKQLADAIERNAAATANVREATARELEARNREEARVILGQEAVLAAKKDALDSAQKVADIKATLALGPAEFAAAMAAKHGGMYAQISDRLISATQDIIKSGQELNRPFSFSQDGLNVFGKIKSELQATRAADIAQRDLTQLGKVISETRTMYNDQLSMLEKSITATPALNEAQKNELAARAKLELAVDASKIDAARAKLVTNNASAATKLAELELKNVERFDTLLTNGIIRIQANEDRADSAALRAAQRAEINATAEERKKLALEKEQQVALNKKAEDESIRALGERLGLTLDAGKQYTAANLDKDFGKDRAAFMRKLVSGQGEGVNVALDPSPAKAIEKARALNIPVLNAGVQRFDEYVTTPEFKAAKKVAESTILNSRAIPAEKAEAESKIERDLFLLSQNNINSQKNPYAGDSRYVTMGLEKRISDRLSASDLLKLDSLKQDPFFSTYLPSVADPSRKDNPNDLDIISAAAKYAAANNQDKQGMNKMAELLSTYYSMQATVNNSVYNYGAFGLPVQQKYGIELSATESGFFGDGSIKLPAKSFDMTNPQQVQQLLMAIQRANTLGYAKRVGK